MTLRVLTNGCFDALHVGHIRLLKYCKTIGHVTVALNSDDSVRRLKGLDRPLNTQEDRVEVLSALKYVDEVVVFDEDTPERLIREFKPDVLVKGGDYELSDIIGSDLCADVRIFPYVPGHSTTSLISRACGR